MNWIKQNPFLSALLGGTLVICGLLTFVALNGSSKYEDAKTRSEDALAIVTKWEKLPLYPSSDNRQAKIKALDDYSNAIDELRGFYSKYQLDPAVQITTQQFTERLKAAHKEVENAFKDADSKLPADFFMGFEGYRGKLANSGSTALLDYQVNAVKHLLLGMAEARPSELIRIHREKISEEEDPPKPYEPYENEVGRKFSYEIVFKGSEASVRDFITKLGAKESYYCVIRSIRINNERETPPRISDAKFEKAPESVVNPGNPFGALFPEEAPAPQPPIAPPVVTPPVVPPVVPPQTDAVVPPGAAALQGAAVGEIVPPVAGEGAVAPAPVAPVAPAPAKPFGMATDTSRILYQVLGHEELQVFVRFDILLFLPTKEVTKP